MNFETEAQVASYVESEAKAGLPRGWILRPMEAPLTWRIAAEGTDSSMENYVLTVSRDLETFILYFDNTDAGPGGVHAFLLNAKVITTKGLTLCPLARALADVVGRLPVNRWGLT